MFPPSHDGLALTVERRVRSAMRGFRPSWKHATFLLLAACFLLMQVAISSSLEPRRPEYPSPTKEAGRPATTEQQHEVGQDMYRQLAQARRRIEELEVAQQQASQQAASGAAASLPGASLPTVVASPPPTPQPVDSNPLRLAPHLDAQCADPDIITMQRWITARQRTYVETAEQQAHSQSSPAMNPDPDPYCQRPKLVVDLLPHHYVWSEADVLKEAQEAAEARGGADAGLHQRVVTPLLADLPNGRRPRRQTGFGLAAQLHVTAQRMIWAWQRGYVYVNLARSAWTKGMKARPPFGDVNADGDTSAPMPFAHDPTYLAQWPHHQLGAIPADSCETGGWDCFFLMHTSPGCYARAREARRQALQLPLVNDLMRARRRELEVGLRVLFDPDMEEHLKQPTYTDLARVRALAQHWTELHDEVDPEVRARRRSAQEDGSQLTKETEFRFDDDDLASDSTVPGSSSDTSSATPPDPSDWLRHSANPWSLPGLSFTSSSSTAKGDLFLLSETLRFFMRPTPYMQRKLHDLLTTMQYPGMRRHDVSGGGAPSAASPSSSSSSLLDDSDRTASQRGVLSIHVRRVVDQRSHALVPIHVTFEYVLLARRLATTLGLSAVFLSSDDPARLPTLRHQLGSGSQREPGLGLQVMHVPVDQLGALPPLVKPVPFGPTTAQQRVAGPNSVDQAVAILDGMLPEEGALHLASLYTMGVFSGAFLGTLSSHWGRLVLEMQRWDEGRCAPSVAGWLLPKDPQAEVTPPRPSSPSYQSRFVDLDGDTYFLGDFKCVRHPRIPQANSPNLDPTIDE